MIALLQPDGIAKKFISESLNKSQFLKFLSKINYRFIIIKIIFMIIFMKSSLIIYSSTDGHTKKICKYILSIIEQKYNTKLISITSVHFEKLEEYDLIIIGASIRYGKHKPEIYHFIEQHKLLLNSKITAFFSVNAVARKSDKNKIDNNPYIQKFISLTSWKPNYLEVFAGQIVYSKYKFIDKIMILLIMWLTNGPTDTSMIHEFTDWSKVKNFSNILIK